METIARACRKVRAKSIGANKKRREARRAEMRCARQQRQKDRREEGEKREKERERGSQQISGESVVSDYDKSHLGLKKKDS